MLGLRGAVLVLSVAAVTTALADEPARFEANRFSIEASGRNVGDLFAAAAKDTGIQFDVDPSLRGKTVSVTVKGLPFEDAMRRLVREIPDASGFSVVWGTERPLRVKIMGHGSPPSGALPASPDPEGAPPEGEPAPEDGAAPIPPSLVPQIPNLEELEKEDDEEEEIIPQSPQSPPESLE